MTALRSPISRRLSEIQKCRQQHWRPGLQSWKPNREEKARKLLKGELRNSSLLKGKKKQTANGNQGNFFVPMLSCFQKKNSCITENNSFSNHKSDYEALQGCKLFIKAKEPEKVDNETFSLGLNATDPGFGQKNLLIFSCNFLESYSNIGWRSFHFADKQVCKA